MFDYPALRNKPVPKVWPSTAVIQGNLEVLRRNYHKVLNDLNASLTGTSCRALLSCSFPLCPLP